MLDGLMLASIDRLLVELLDDPSELKPSIAEYNLILLEAKELRPNIPAYAWPPEIPKMVPPSTAIVDAVEISQYLRVVRFNIQKPSAYNFAPDKMKTG